MNRKYVLSLAIAAAVILVGGSLIRPRDNRSQSQPAPATQSPPPTRRGQMRQISDFLWERTSEYARHVVYVPSEETSGVAWPDGTVVVSARNSSPVAGVPMEPGVPVYPVALATERQAQGAWAVIVGRDARQQVVSASSITGGTAEVECGGSKVRKILLNVSLDSALAGAGVFDMTGGLIGMVVRCGDAWVAITQESVSSLLGQQTGTAARVWRDFGVRTGDPSELERKLLRIDRTGLYVREVRLGSRADGAGVQPGDVLLRAGTEPVKGAGDLLGLRDTLTLQRSGRSRTVDPDPLVAFEHPDAAAVIASVRDASRLFVAGVRTGDRVVRAGAMDNPNERQLRQMLARKNPFFLIYERADRVVGTVVE